MDRRLALPMMLLCLAALPLDAHAGAWPRDRGTGFLSTSVEVLGFQDAQYVQDIGYYASVYLEYGLTDALTLGLQTGQDNTAADGRVFLRTPVLSGDTHKFALEFSLGGSISTIDGDAETWVGLGLHYGRGFQIWDRNGWLSAESSIDFQPEGGGMSGYRQSKLDLTLGLAHPNGLKTMAQLYLTEADNDFYATFAPGLAIPIGSKHNIETGLLFDMTHGNDWGLKFGLWREF